MQDVPDEMDRQFTGKLNNNKKNEKDNFINAFLAGRNRMLCTKIILGKAVQGKAESFDLNGNNVVPWSDKAWIWGLALNGSINYRICSGLYAGIGIEPTGYFKTDKLKENLEGRVFDFPIVLTLGYEFKNGMKLSASYKHGFKPLYDNAFASNTKNNKEFGISLYVPMFK